MMLQPITTIRDDAASKIVALYDANVDNLSRIYGTFRIDKDGATVEPVFVGESK